ncbi:MAG: glycosyltransferase family 2 protein [Candidatus Micrarchaeota archaeon]|nr:glycosyltransferase family 2 protein [Candidatus Micrarchaeota archaeon]
MEKNEGRHKRSTISIPQRRELAIVGMVVVALCVFIFLFISYKLIFLAYSVLSIFIFSFYLILWTEGANTEKPGPTPKKWPHVTIIIPSFNAKSTIFDCIRSCQRMKYPGKFDILVVDDGSTDGSASLLERLPGITLLKSKVQRGKAHALNFGIMHAKGEIVACVDSDTYPSEDALEKAVKHFYEDERVASVVVFISVNKPKNLLQRIQEIEYWISFGFFFKTIASIDGLYVTPGPTTFYRKDILQKLGGFDEQNLTEDMEIALRMQKFGYKIRACHETMVLTEVPDTLPKLFRQRLRWYRGGVMNILKYIDLFFNPKYGDFGLFILPTALGSGFFAALFMAWTFMSWGKGLLSWILPFGQNFSAGLGATAAGLGSGIIMFQSAWILGLFSLSLWGYFLIKSFEISRTQPKWRHVLPLFCLLWVYPFFIGFVFLVSYIYELFGVKYSW